MEGRMKALIAIGASVTANCQPCLSYYVSKAKETGADEREIAMAIEVAKAVRKGAAAKMDDFAAGLGAAAETAACCADRSCGCGA
jgi:AhpD family alkylhydroperoxidase